MDRGRVRSVVFAVAMIGAFSAGAAGPAAAATGSGYGAWTVSGVGGAYAGTVTLPAGFPDVAFTSDSRGAVGIATSATQPAGSSFGSVFGASTGEQYVGLRPAGGTGTTSTTVYTFSHPTPAGTWGIALGDIDAEAITVSATSATNSPVSAADLGFQTAGNSGNGPDTLTATASATGYSVEDVQCPVDQGRCNTEGATAWFRPAVPLASLTVASTYKSGAPVYQTWFATLVRAISGTVTVPDDIELAEPPVLTLTDSADTVVATTTAAGDGSYLFDTLAARDDYTVAIDPASIPDGVTASSPLPIDTVVADATGADFTLEAAVITGSITGAIVDPAGDPVPGAEVVVSGGPDAGAPVEDSDVTDAQGEFAIEDLPFGDYTVEVVPPAASGLSPSSATVTVGADTPAILFALESAVAPPPPPEPTPTPTPTPPVPAPVSPPPAAAPGDELAATGYDPLHGGLLGAVLLLAGAAVLTRRRRASALADI